MKFEKHKKPTNKQLSRDMGFLVKEVMMVKDYIKDVVSPTLQSTMAMFESYLKFKGETPSFLNGKTQYTNSEMLEQLETSEWIEEIQ